MKQRIRGKAVATPAAGWWSKVQRHRGLVPRDDAGIGIVELIVAVVLIVLVSLAGIVAIDYGLTQSGAQRNKVEAINLATAQMEQAALVVSAASSGTTTATDTLNNTVFTVATTVTALAQNGGQLTTVCTSSDTDIAQQVWEVTVAVTWPQMNGTPPVSESTDVQPNAGNATNLLNGEIAVEVESGAGRTQAVGAPLDEPVIFTVTPEYVGPAPTQTYSPPSGETSPVGQTFNTGDDGCGIVTGLSSSTNWDYVVTITGNAGWVASTEQSDTDPDLDPTPPEPASPGTGDPYWVGAAPEGVVTITNPFVESNAGSITQINFQPVTYACAGGSPVTTPGAGYCGSASGAAAVADLPVTFANPSLANGQYTFGNASQAISSVLAYPYLYGVWAGDMTASSPGYNGPSGGGTFYTGPLGTESPVPISYDPTPPTGVVNVPVYQLNITEASPSACPGVQLTATEQAGADYTYNLYAANAGNVSSSGMPLGQFEVSASNCSTITPEYVWITPTGVYWSPTLMTNPYTNGVLAGTSVTVTL
jgi:Tfp pilus assembly protein PilV